MRNRATLLQDVPSATKRVLPVYVYHLATTHALLFDAGHQAVGFGSLVLGVTTHAGDIPSRIACGGRPMLLPGAAIQAPLLEAVLLAGWGVTPHSLSRAGVAAVTGLDVRQCVADAQDGAFSFGAMSWSDSLSFVQVRRCEMQPLPPRPPLTSGLTALRLQVWQQSLPPAS